MVLRVRSVIIFVTTLWTMIILTQSESTDYDDVDSDDEDTLREALLLIKLIRSGPPVNISLIANLFSKNSNLISAPSLPNSPQPPMNVPHFRNVLQPIPNHRRNAQPRLNRRKMSKTHAFDSYENIEEMPKMKPALYRRQDYEDMFGPHPPATSTTAAPTTTVATTTEATPITTITTTISTTTASSTPSTKLPTATSETQVNAKTTAPKEQTKKKTKLSMAKNPNIETSNQTDTQNTGNGTDPQANDPITHQVESELKNEMKGVLSHKKEASITKQNDKGKAIPKPLSTLRIHLESSTRYPLPLPENHALCYTDPQNGLCRTPI